ncbi:MAG: PP2C family protein-serine/threonine phosphatase [Gammaproteobacteria bacterium]|nr:PP2C family protein-serine/threonine phosphatase [Gammaproteobacteria bacterium]
MVFLSAAYKSEEFQQKGFANGAADYLTKPIDPALLLNRIRSYVRFIEQERRYRRELEQKVQERTAQLDLANREITALNKCLQDENRRMGTELDVAQHLQQMVLPRDRELEQVPGLDIAGFMEPAEEVGGDYYDVLQYEGKVRICIGDVTGHGLESGVLMLMIQTAVRTLTINGVSEPKIFFSVLNRILYDNVERMGLEKNTSLVLLDYEQGRMRLSGQHEEILVVRSTGEIEQIDTQDLGFPLGLVPDIADFIAQLEIQLQNGDGVVVFTDGITEAQNEAEELYGAERLCNTVKSNWRYSAHAIQQAVVKDVKRHIGVQKPVDDITLLVLKHTEK